MTKKSIFLTSLFLISIFYFLFSIFRLPLVRHINAQYIENGRICESASHCPDDDDEIAEQKPNNLLDKCADPNYRRQDPVGCASEKSGGGGEPGVGYLFYCAKPGNPTGIDPWHVCTDDDNPNNRPQTPPSGICYGGWAYDKRDGCTYMVDPCQAEFFGDTSGLCRGESWEELVAGCRLINEGTPEEGCEKIGFAEFDPCIRCEYHKARYIHGEGWEPAYCSPMRNNCCTAASEGRCNSIPGCWWNCPSGSLITPTPTHTPTPTPIPAPNCKT